MFINSLGINRDILDLDMVCPAEPVHNTKLQLHLQTACVSVQECVG